MELLLQMNAAAAVLIAAVVIIRALALYKFPKKTFLFFWGVVALRLLIPVRIPLHVELFPSRNLTPSRTALNTSEMIYTGGTVSQAPGTVDQAVTTQFPFAAVWIAGICTVAIFFLASYLRFRREANASLPCENAFAALWPAEHPLRRTIRVRQTDRVSAPLTYGVLRPVILLPKTTDWQNEDVLRCIFAHEHVHIRRFDTLIKLAFAAVACIHWFNPMVWTMYILANRDIELSCDEAATDELGSGQKSVYLQVLIALEETRTRMAFPLVSHFGKHAAKERMTAIMKKGKYTAPVLVAAAALILCIGTAAIAAVSDRASYEPVIRENTVYVSLEQSAREHGYTVIVEQEGFIHEVKKQKGVEYDYTLKDGGEYLGCLSIAVYGDEIGEVLGDQGFGALLKAAKSSEFRDIFIFHNGEIYVPENFFSAAPRIPTEDDIAFEIRNFAGNGTLSQTVEITEAAPYWELVVVNKGTSDMIVDAGSTMLKDGDYVVLDGVGDDSIHRVEAGCTAVIRTDALWEPGTYLFGFASGHPDDGMQGNAICFVAESAEKAGSFIVGEAQMEIAPEDYQEIRVYEQKDFDSTLPTWSPDAG